MTKMRIDKSKFSLLIESNTDESALNAKMQHETNPQFRTCLAFVAEIGSKMSDKYQ